MTPNLVELVSRIEAASGPDRELDRDIADALGFGPPDDWSRWPRHHNGVINMNCGDWLKGSRLRSSERYTASLDAAMSLVPEGCGYALWTVLGKKPCAAIQFPCSDDLPPGSVTVDGWSDWSGAATPALALCSAALRSRSLTDEER